MPFHPQTCQRVPGEGATPAGSPYSQGAIQLRGAANPPGAHRRSTTHETPGGAISRGHFPVSDLCSGRSLPPSDTKGPRLPRYKQARKLWTATGFLGRRGPGSLPAGSKISFSVQAKEP